MSDYYLNTFAYKKNPLSEYKFLHSTSKEHPVKALMELNRNNEATYTLINSIRIPDDVDIDKLWEVL